MAKKRIIDDWERGTFFGVPVLRGYIEGQRVCVRFLYRSAGRLGVTRNSNGVEEVLAEGRQWQDNAYGL